MTVMGLLRCFSQERAKVIDRPLTLYYDENAGENQDCRSGEEGDIDGDGE